MDKSVLSHWWRKMETENGGPIAEREPLDGDVEADIVIAGAGYTGLWLALELLYEEPRLKIVLLEAKIAGYGASGRNGGAVIAQLNGSRDFWSKRSAGRDGAIRMQRAVQDSVDRIGDIVSREHIDCGYGKYGVITVARNELEAALSRRSVDEDRAYGFGPEHSRYLDRDEAADRINVAGAVGARFSPHCASVDGARLARGLAQAVEKRGGVIYERTPVRRIEPHRAITATGTVHAKYVVRATEAYTDSIENQRRELVPVHTSMLATEVLDDAAIEQLRWNGHEALLAEHPFLHLQFTTDNRITIGGDDPRVPYRWRSMPNVDGPASPKVFDHYRRELVKLFPFLDGVAIADSWQGVFGTRRSWAPGVGLDSTTGIGYAGGYVGEGLAAANLAGRTLRDLILGRSTDLTALPWTNLRSRRWEPEPLRILGAGLIWGARAVGERLETRTGKASALVSLGNRAAGFTGRLG